jgi:hypothetical protein
MGADMGVQRSQAGRAPAWAIAAGLLALAGTGCSNGLRAGAPVLIEPAGAAGLQATAHGVVWSLQQASGGPAVLRSADSGRTWRIVLSSRQISRRQISRRQISRRQISRRQISSRLTASYFLGPTYAWVVQAHRRRSGDAEITTIIGTSNSGLTWWRSRPLPRDRFRSRGPADDQVYFADPEHGWLLNATTRPSAPSAARPGQPAREVLRLWRTIDGGHTWTRLPARTIPLQGLSVPRACNGTGYPQQPRVTFANANAGWLTEGSCGSGQAGPSVWRTRSAGRRWLPARLATPPGGWGDDPLSRGMRANVGPARVVDWRVSAIVLVPVTDGPTVVIEKSTDGGQTWTIAAQVRTAATAGTPAVWFDPLNKNQWVISAPGELIETANAGRTWTYHKSDMILAGAPVSFSSLNYGFLHVTGLASAMLTTNGGQTWTAEAAPIGGEPGPPHASGRARARVMPGGPRRHTQTTMPPADTQRSRCQCAG